MKNKWTSSHLPLSLNGALNLSWKGRVDNRDKQTTDGEMLASTINFILKKWLTFHEIEVSKAHKKTF